MFNECIGLFSPIEEMWQITWQGEDLKETTRFRCSTTEFTRRTLSPNFSPIGASTEWCRKSDDFRWEIEESRPVRTKLHNCAR